MSEVEEIDYAAALRECGFDEEWVARGVGRAVRETREGFYRGFGDLVRSLRIGGGHTALREHHVAPIVARIEKQEAGARISARGAQASNHVAAARADEAQRSADARRGIVESNSQLVELMGRMTDQELEGRTPMRPHIREAWDALFPPDRR